MKKITDKLKYKIKEHNEGRNNNDDKNTQDELSSLSPFSVEKEDKPLEVEVCELIATTNHNLANPISPTDQRLVVNSTQSSQHNNTSSI